MRTGLLLTVQPRYNEHVKDNTDLSKCVAALILATCALKDVMPKVGGEGRGERGEGRGERGEGGGGRGAGWCQCLSVCNSNVLLCMSCRRCLDKISLLFFTFGSYSFPQICPFHFHSLEK